MSFQEEQIDIEKRLNSTLKLFRDPEGIENLFGDQKALLKKTLQLIEKYSQEIKKGKKVNLEKSEVRSLREVTELFLDYALQEKITPLFRELSRTLLPLVDFLVVNCAGSNLQVRRNIKSVLALLGQNKTLEETFVVMQKLLEKVRLFQEYEPPSFELSKEYLDSLEKEKGNNE